MSAVVGCKSDRERQHQGQVARLAEHIDRLRRADNPDKAPLLSALAAVECPDAEACALKDLCLRAYRLHQGALDTIAALRRAAEQDAAAAPPDVAERLGRAQADLDAAQALAERCAEEQVRVVRRAFL